MKLAIAIIRDTFSHGSIASIAVCDEKTALFHLRRIDGNTDEIDVRLYQVEEEAKFGDFTDGFIGNDGIMDIKGSTAVGYKFLCSLTPQK